MRLGNFKRHLVPIATQPGRQEFHVAEGLEIQKWDSFKPLSFIREILQRIHRLVHRLDFESEK